MKAAPSKQITFALGLSAVLMLLLHAVVLQRSEVGETRWLEISPDTAHYLEMISGGAADVPFRYRPLVPFLAALLPLEGLDALAAISSLCLFASILVLIRILQVAGVDRLALAIAMLGFATSTRTLFLVQNPFGPDGWGLLATSLMLLFLIQGYVIPFGLTAVLGIPGREEVLFGAPALVVGRHWRAGLVITVIATATYFWIRLGGPAMTAVPLGFSDFTAWQYYAKMYFALGGLWSLAALGAVLAGSRDIAPSLPFFGLGLVGSLISTHFAQDTVRVFLPVLAVSTLFAGVAIQVLRDHPAVRTLWGLAFLAWLFLAMPNRLLPEGPPIAELEDWYARLLVPIAMHTLFVVALSIWTTWVLRVPLASGLADWRRIAREILDELRALAPRP